MKLLNKERAVLEILKNPKRELNANSLSKILGISSMGTLNILKKLEGEKILVSKKVSNMNMFNIDFENSYARDYAFLVLRKEMEFSVGVAKRWINEVGKIKSSNIAIVFGSVLNSKNPGDIDVLFVVEKKKFGELKEEVDKINLLNEKNIHPVYQTTEDFLGNIKKEDVVVIEAIKGIVVYGGELFVKLIGGLR